MTGRLGEGRDLAKVDGEGAQPSRMDLALGLRIRQRRKAMGLSQTALAESVGITFQQIQKYERGFNRVSFSRLVNIAHALDCRVIDLVGDLDDPDADTPLFKQQADHLREPGAPELLAAFAAAPRPIRRVILQLVREIRKDQLKASGLGPDAQGEAP
jgi:transcriptional regulator with XRE-family HTH domain